MKNLIFLFLGFFCFANSQTDSARIVQKLNQIDKTYNQTIKMVEKIDKLEAENQSLIYKIKLYIKKLTQKREVVLSDAKQPQAIKAKNINEPVEDDTIRASFLYRLFHREKVYLRAYKLQENEKIYLD